MITDIDIIYIIPVSVNLHKNFFIIISQVYYKPSFLNLYKSHFFYTMNLKEATILGFKLKSTKV